MTDRTIQEQGGTAFPAQFYDERAIGMTLRDYFAVRVLPMAMEQWKNADAGEDGGGLFDWGLISDGAIASDCICAAEMAYSMADAMLEARTR